MRHLDEVGDEELADLYGHPGPRERSYVRANFISTLDGSATGDDGRTASINDEADFRVFGLLRALCDVVLVGAGTVRDEGYGRVRTAAAWLPLRASLGLPDHPVTAVVTRSLDLPEQLVREDPAGGDLMVIATQDADASRLATLTARLGRSNIVLAGRGSVDLVSAFERLAGAGLSRVLTEGGPQLMNDIARADLLDDLCLTVAPMLVGGHGPRVAAGAPLRNRMRLEHALRSDGSLLTRWTRA